MCCMTCVTAFTFTSLLSAMAHLHTAEVVVRDQQTYAKQHDIPGVFEGLTIALLYKKPADPIAFIAEEAKRMSESKTYEAKSVRRIDFQVKRILCPLPCVCSRAVKLIRRLPQ